MTLLVALLLQVTALQRQQVFDSANKLMPGVEWNQNSIVLADFTCRGQKEYAILGTVNSEAAKPYAIVAVFLDGLNKQPQLIRDSVHIAADVKLSAESLDYDPKEEIGSSIQGFRRSKTCKGLNLADDRTDSLHIFWNHELKDFDWWRR